MLVCIHMKRVCFKASYYFLLYFSYYIGYLNGLDGARVSIGRRKTGLPRRNSLATRAAGGRREEKAIGPKEREGGTKSRGTTRKTGLIDLY